MASEPTRSYHRAAILGAVDVIGRDDELALVEKLLRPGAPPAALLIEGEPGIGKTTLWRRALDVARESSYRVLAASPAEAERELAFGGLLDLVGAALEEVRAELPAPQARGLDVALRIAEPGREPADRLAIGAGFLGVLRGLAARGPLAVAVDDVQWLDPETEQALAFAVRRLRDEQVAFVLGRRTPARPTMLPLGLDRAAGARQVAELALGPLSLGATHALLRARLGTPVARRVLLRIHETSGGNPFFALELGRALALRDGAELPPGEPLPVPASLDALVQERIGRLRPRTRDVLLAAAALARPSVELLEETFGRRVVAAALAEARSAGVVAAAGDRIRFAHPVLASACAWAASPEQRRGAHRRVARAVRDPEERARHLALAHAAPDEAVAHALETAAGHAAARGAPEAAAALAELAVARTPPEDGAALFRRRLAAGGESLRAGDARRALAHFGDALVRAAPGGDRAEALLRLAEAEDDPGRVVELCERALAEALGEPMLRCRAHHQLARASARRGAGASAVEHARAALELAEAAGDPPFLVATLTEAAEIEYRFGRSDRAPGLLDRALALEPLVRVAVRASPRLSLARALVHQERLDEARSVYTTLLTEAEAQGDEYARHRILWNLVLLELTAGDFERAYRRALEGLELARAGGLAVAQSLLNVGDAAAHLGRVDEARAAVEEAAAAASGEAGETLYTAYSHGKLGFLELSLGRAEAAAEQLAAAAEQLQRSGSRVEAVAIGIWANRIEALVQLGRAAEARTLLERYADVGSEYRFPGQLAIAARCRGLVLAAEGRLDEARAAFEDALRDHGSAGNAFERARTLLCHGSTLRRAKRRGDARHELEAATAEFERLSTPLWAEKARGELARIGGRTRSGELTQTERRLAELVATGRSNKEIAAALFVTPKTVSTGLSRIYAKLGLRSRAELVRFVLEKSKL